jgi:hypothetical protein
MGCVKVLPTRRNAASMHAGIADQIINGGLHILLRRRKWWTNLGIIDWA